MFHMMTLAQTRGCFEDRPFLPDRGYIVAAIAEIKVRTVAGTTRRVQKSSANFPQRVDLGYSKLSPGLRLGRLLSKILGFRAILDGATVAPVSGREAMISHRRPSEYRIVRSTSMHGSPVGWGQDTELQQFSNCA